ncbi:hypothetical protein BJ912DRAFT_1045107 [Pholiota molesta]|nr:hypothetical protein BJ912DRAFT_1045107 [Pholiota molesta]
MSSSTFDDLVESGCDALRLLSLEHSENMMDESAEASPSTISEASAPSSSLSSALWSAQPHLPATQPRAWEPQLTALNSAWTAATGVALRRFPFFLTPQKAVPTVPFSFTYSEYEAHAAQGRGMDSERDSFDSLGGAYFPNDTSKQDHAIEPTKSSPYLFVTEKNHLFISSKGPRKAGGSLIWPSEQANGHAPMMTSMRMKILNRPRVKVTVCTQGEEDENGSATPTDDMAAQDEELGCKGDSALTEPPRHAHRWPIYHASIGVHLFGRQEIPPPVSDRE